MIMKSAKEATENTVELLMNTNEYKFSDIDMTNYSHNDCSQEKSDTVAS